MTEHDDYAVHPLHVHIASAEPGLIPSQPAVTAKPRRIRLAIATRTVVLTATNPVQSLVNHEPNRCRVDVAAIDNPVVICDSYGQANDQANITATLPNPNGMLVPVTNQPWQLETTDALYVTAAAYPSRVSVAVYSYADD